MYLLNPEDCLNCTASIHRRNVGASLVEVNEGLSEIIIRQQVNTRKENLKIKVLGFMHALIKCTMKIKTTAA